MSNGTQSALDGSVLLDAWHVALYVDRDLSGTQAKEFRSLLEAELTRWAQALVRQLRALAPIRIDVEQ